jgi:hypothetical protein
MDSFDLVNSLQALPETNPIDIDGIQFGPTCVNLQTDGNGICRVSSINVRVLQIVNSGIGGAVFAQGCWCVVKECSLPWFGFAA